MKDGPLKRACILNFFHVNLLYILYKYYVISK